MQARDLIGKLAFQDPYKPVVVRVELDDQYDDLAVLDVELVNNGDGNPRLRLITPEIRIKAVFL